MRTLLRLFSRSRPDADAARSESQTVAALRQQLAAKERELAAAWEHAHKLDAPLQRYDQLFRSADHNADSLMVWNRNLGFLRDPAFLEAYRAGIDSGHRF